MLISSHAGTVLSQVNKTFSIEPERTGTFVMNVRVTYTAFLIPRTVAEGSMKFVLSGEPFDCFFSPVRYISEASSLFRK